MLFDTKIPKHLDKAISILNDVQDDYERLASENADYEKDNEALREALEEARQYYDASQHEIEFLLSQCSQAGMTLPVEGHSLNINDLAPESDRGRYEEPFGALDNFVYWP